MSRRLRAGLAVAVGVAAALHAVPCSPQPTKAQPGDAALAQRWRAASRSVGGVVGIAAVHVETGRAVEVLGRRLLALYSVFKLPLAVAILNDVDEGRLRLRTELLLRMLAKRRWDGVREETIVLRATVQGLVAGMRTTRRAKEIR